MIITLNELVEQFNIAKRLGADGLRLNAIAEEIQALNMKSYGDGTPFIERRTKITPFELSKWERLERYFAPSTSVRLFDAAFGSGRDLMIAHQLGYDTFGCELSAYLYNDFLKNNKTFANKIIQCDIRDIPYPNESFHIVRHNASLLHMPIVGSGYTVHKCLAESYRLLKDNGLLYLYLKEGQGFTVIDTGDNLGGRSFQLYNQELIVSILNECGFIVDCVNRYSRPRNDKNIEWIEIFSKKQTRG